MSKTAVIYCSRTGFSARYAKWIAKALHADLYRYKTIDSALLSQYQTLIYGAGFYCGFLKGRNWLKKLIRPLTAQKVLVYATGSMPRVQPQDLQQEWDMNFTAEEQSRLHLFYLPGGMNYARLSPPEQILMRLYRMYMLCSSKTRDDTRSLMKDLDHSVDYTDREAIVPLLEEACGHPVRVIRRTSSLS